MNVDSTWLNISNLSVRIAKQTAAPKLMMATMKAMSKMMMNTLKKMISTATRKRNESEIAIENSKNF
jgi:hypothetical protein